MRTTRDAADANDRDRLIVAGTGPAGLIAALALAHAGFEVTLAGPEIGQNDLRTTALMAPALEMLDRLGVGEDARSAAAPLEAMRIVDATTRLIRSPVVTFRAREIGEAHFGLNIPNRDLNAILAAAVSKTPSIRWVKNLVADWSLESHRAVATLTDGTLIAGPLAVAADGRLSPARSAAGIAVSGHTLPQSALALTFRHTRPHGSISTEFHTESGPFTQVPLAGLRSSLVWVVQPRTAEELLQLDDETLSRRVEDRMQSMLGGVTVEPGRQVFPLAASTPRRFAQNRVALVGEAAHIFPPIGAQGLNLGIKDVIDLIEIATQFRDDPGSPAALAAYDAKRRPDILARSTAVNLLNRSLLSDFLPAQLVRSAGLSALGALAPLRTLFMREGLRTGSGLRGLLSDLGEQIRR
jgi:2-octaprenyl-6-methoxyphenol hydroxylase